MKDSTEKLLSTVTTEEEMEFLKSLDGSTGATLEREHISANFYLTKIDEQTTNKQIESHKKYAFALNCLTGALVLTTLAQVVVLLFAGK